MFMICNLVHDLQIKLLVFAGSVRHNRIIHNRAAWKPNLASSFGFLLGNNTIDSSKRGGELEYKDTRSHCMLRKLA